MKAHPVLKLDRRLLLQLMAKQQRPVQQMPATASGGSSFNFAYTIEGEDEPEQPSTKNIPQPPPPQMVPPQGMHMGYPPPPMAMMAPNFYVGQPMPIVGHPGMPLSTMPMMTQQLPNVQPYPVTNGGKSSTSINYAARNHSSNVAVSEEEFPPLGSTTPAKKEQQNSVPTPEDSTTPKETPVKPKTAPRSFLVPSNVKAGKK